MTTWTPSSSRSRIFGEHKPWRSLAEHIAKKNVHISALLVCINYLVTSIVMFREVQTTSIGSARAFSSREKFRETAVRSSSDHRLMTGCLRAVWWGPFYDYPPRSAKASGELTVGLGEFNDLLGQVVFQSLWKDHSLGVHLIAKNTNVNVSWISKE